MISAKAGRRNSRNYRTWSGCLLLLAVLLLTGSSVWSQQQSEQPESVYLHSHQAGIRLGAWANLGDSPLDSLQLTSTAYYLTDFSGGSFYFEGFLGYRISRLLVAELSVGIVNRGDVSLFDLDSFYGSLLVYPILLKARVYPVGKVGGRFYPYLLAGAGLYYARHDIQIVSSSYGFYGFIEEDSETRFGYVVGGGFDWPLASVVALDFNVQYMPIDYSTKIIGITDYSSLTVTIGVKYLFSSDKDKKDDRPMPMRRRR